MQGPLAGLRIVEIAGIGPGPFAGMMLADLGAEVIRVDRITAPGAAVTSPANVLRRNRLAVAADLSSDAGRDLVLDLVEHSDALFEPFRPGVAERLGFGPEACLERNPRLVYGRVTGWGQDGPVAARAGHDINYIALAGALEPLGRRDGPPVPPLNVVGDFAGGGLLLAFGIVCAVLEAQRSGQGQVVDAAMVDGASLLMSMFHSLRALGVWHDVRGTNELDTGSHYYQVYETADGLFVAVGAIEPHFYAVLLAGLGLAPEEFPQGEPSRWPELAERFAEVFRTRTRDEWVAVFEGQDACLSPVLSLAEVPSHPHHVARDAFLNVGGVVQPAPAPRFSRTPGKVRWPSPPAGHDTERVLHGLLGYSPTRIGSLREQGVLGPK